MKYSRIEAWASKSGGAEMHPAVRAASIQALAQNIGWESREQTAKAVTRIAFAVLFLLVCAASGLIVFLVALKRVSIELLWAERFWEVFKYSILGVGAKYVFGGLAEKLLPRSLSAGIDGAPAS